MSLSNRLIQQYQNSMTTNHSVFREVLKMTEECLTLAEHEFEKKGAVYMSLGNLYVTVEDWKKALEYFKLAKKQFTISNYRYLESAEMAIGIYENY